MGIGTSLGAYFDDSFHHQAGIETPEVVKPGDTGDDNVQPPDPKPEDTSNTPIQVAAKLPPDVAVAPADADSTAKPGFMDRLLGTNGAERYQTWPERIMRGMIPDETLENLKGISEGSVPMWAMDPETGEFHTSPEAIKTGVGLSIAANTGNAAGAHTAEDTAGQLVVHLRGEGHDALQQGPDVFQQFMATRGRGQASNIVEHEPIPGDAAPYHLRTQHPDTMSDHDFYDWGQYQPENGMAPHQEERWLGLDQQSEIERVHRVLIDDGLGLHPDLQQPFRDDYSDLRVSPNEQASVFAQRAKTEALREFEARPDDVTTKGNMSLLKTGGLPGTSYSDPLHQFKFMSDEGNIGELSIRETDGGKSLYVPWIGTVQGNGAGTMGHSEIRNLLNIVKDTFPKAETISGFRVSGARNEVGKIGNAEMRLRSPTP